MAPGASSGGAGAKILKTP